MKTFKLLVLLNLLALCTLMTGCVRTRNEIWEDSKSAGRHVTRGIRALGGQHGSSRQIQSRDDFSSVDNYAVGEDFVPLMDDEIAMGEVSVVQPAETPGEAGSSVPGIEAFRDPVNDSVMANIFKQVRFALNSNLVKGRQNFSIVARAADYMKKNPNVYIFVEGHCCEKGPDAFNLALGTRRANAVRNLLISEGVDPDHIFTISYGKERPVAVGHDEEALSPNRRVEFKVWNRGS